MDKRIFCLFGSDFEKGTMLSLVSYAPPGKTNLLGINIACFPLCPISILYFLLCFLTITIVAASLISVDFVLSKPFFLIIKFTYCKF